MVSMRLVLVHVLQSSQLPFRVVRDSSQELALKKPKSNKKSKLTE